MLGCVSGHLSFMLLGESGWCGGRGNGHWPGGRRQGVEGGSLARTFFRQCERAVKMLWVRFTYDAAHSNRLWGAGILANILLAVDERYIGL